MLRRAVELPLFVGAAGIGGALAAWDVVPPSVDPSTDQTLALGLIAGVGLAIHLIPAVWVAGMALDLLPWRLLRGAGGLVGGLGAVALAIRLLRDQPVHGALAAVVAASAGLALTASSALPAGPGRWPALPLIVSLALAVLAALSAGGLAATGSMTSVYALFVLVALSERSPAAGCCVAVGLLVLAPLYGSAAALASGPAAALWVLVAALGALFTTRRWRWLWWVAHSLVAVGAAVGWSFPHEIAKINDRALLAQVLFVLSVGGANAGLLGALVLGHVPPPEDRVRLSAQKIQVKAAPDLIVGVDDGYGQSPISHRGDLGAQGLPADGLAEVAQPDADRAANPPGPEGP